MTARAAILLLLMTSVSVLPAVAQDRTLYPTLPGTGVRDYSKPGWKVEGDKIYPTRPGTNLRDYSKPGYRLEEGR